MKQFYLITNSDKEHAEEATWSICSYLEFKGCGCAVQGESPAEGPKFYEYTDASQVPEWTECVIILGGGSTPVQTARNLMGRQISIVRVDLETFGYLTQISRQEDITQTFNDLINDQYRMERRMILKGSIYRDGGEIYEGLALNEIVFTRREILQVLKFGIYINEDCLNEYTADGMVVVMPTGSTVHNLSAGDPIAEPAVGMTTLTPTYPHALNMRSIVFPAEDRIEIETTDSDDGGQAIVYDGDAVWDVKPGDRIKIEETETETLLVKLKHISSLDSLREETTGV